MITLISGTWLIFFFFHNGDRLPQRMEFRKPLPKEFYHIPLILSIPLVDTCELILHQAKGADNRSHYQEVCKLLRRFGKDLDSEKMRALVLELKAAYPRRRAFQEELSKV
jgi:hypothetical protein